MIVVSTAFFAFDDDDSAVRGVFVHIVWLSKRWALPRFAQFARIKAGG